MLSVLLLSGILLAPASQASGHAVSAGVTPGQLSPAAVKLKPEAVSLSAASVTPSAIGFTANNPDSSPVVSGASSAVVTFKTSAGFFGTWNLKVSAPSSFGACSTVPASAVTVSCVSATGGQNPACGGPVTLSSSPTQIASGTEGLIFSTTYNVTLSFTLADSWKYIASSLCSLSVTYTITAN